MDLGSDSYTAPVEREVIVTRVFDAPRSRVFEAWNRPEHLSRWWGPRGFTLAACELEFRPGGTFRFVMRGPDGLSWPFDGTYMEIVSPERIVFTGTLDGERIPTTVTFVGRGGKTALVVRQAIPSNPDYARGQKQGWTESLERLAELLAG